MNRIFVDMDGLGLLKVRLSKISCQLNNLELELMRSLNQFDWAVSSKEEIKEQMYLARRQATTLAKRSCQIRLLLDKVINEFSETDRKCISKQKEAASFIDKVWRALIEINSRTFNQVTWIGMKLLAAFKKAGLLFIHEPNEVKKTNLKLLTNTVGNRKISTKPILTDGLSNNLKTNLQRQGLIFNGILSYNPKKYDKNVELMQRRLKDLGYKDKNGKPIVVDGRFGENTLYAVNEFKRLNKLINSGSKHGKVDNFTWGLLFSTVAVKGQTNTTNNTAKNTTRSNKGEKDQTKTNVPRTNKPGSMQISDNLVKFLTGYEGFVSKPYRGQDKGNLTIGYGHVIQKGENFSRGISKSEALELLKKDINSRFGKVINNWAKKNSLNLTQNQFDALVSFSYNIGAPKFLKSCVAKDILKGVNDPEKLKDDFLKYVKVRDPETKEYFTSKGLKRRRSAEWAMFIKDSK